jgi:hypothetical protein
MAEVTGGRGTDPLGSITDQLRELVAAHGSEVKAAQATGFARSTFWRWKVGRTTPKVSTMAKVAGLIRAARVDPGRPTDKGIQLTVAERRPGRRDGTERHLTGKQIGVRQGTMAAVVAAYKATGDPEVMARVFVAGVGVGFYKNWLSAGLDVEPAGPVDGGDEGDAEDEAVWDLYEDFEVPDEWDLVDESGDVPDAGDAYAFDVA